MTTAVEATSTQGVGVTLTGRRDISQLVIAVVEEFIGSDDFEDDEELSVNTVLFGEDGVLDSLELVRLVVATEQAIEDEYGIAVSLADEKAMSEHNGPYRSIGTLAEYAQKLIAES